MHAPIPRRLPRTGLDPIVLGTVAAAWALMLALATLHVTGVHEHGALLDASRGPALPQLLLSVGTWQLMTAAMMLPSSLPMLRAFAAVANRAEHPRAALSAFVAAYFAIWTGFAALAIGGSLLIGHLITAWPWLDRHEWLVGASVLIAAGLFQFSSLKERCLTECRSPTMFLWSRYRRGLAAAWSIGLSHGVFCLGCCWALMLLMIVVGMGNLVAMAGLTGVMLFEKTHPLGRRLVPLVGVVLVFLGLLSLLPPPLPR